MGTATGTAKPLGLDPNVAAAVAYVFGIVSGLLVLVLDDSGDEFVEFHAKQSIVFSAVLFAVYVLLGIVSAVLSFVPEIGGILAALFGLLYPVVGLAGFLVWLFLMYKAYDGAEFALPVIGNVVRSV